MNTFKRIENKYFLPVSLREKFVKALTEELKLPQSKFDKDYTLVGSIYLDTDDLFCYRSHFKLGESRFKVRVRSYYPDGGAWDSSYMELKTKRDGVCEKIRFPITKDEMKKIPRQFKNASVGPVQDINNLLMTYNLRPVAKVMYQRQSFENDDIRITIDKKVKSKLLRKLDKNVMEGIMASPSWFFADFMKEYYDGEDLLIVEVKDKKCANGFELPLAIRDILNNKRVHFSKYIYAITSGIKRSVKV